MIGSCIRIECMPALSRLTRGVRGSGGVICGERPTESDRGSRDVTLVIDAPSFRLKSLARETCCEPIRSQCSDVRSQHRRGNAAADRMPRFLIDHDLSRAWQSAEQAHCILYRAELVRSSSDTQKWHVNLLHTPFPCQRLREFVECRFVADVRHKHEPHLERRRCFFKDRAKPGLETCGTDGNGTKARFV